MDLDAYVAERSGEWQRLQELSGRRRLTAAEADELVVLYQRATTHLSIVRSHTPDPVVLADLSKLLLAGRAAITRGRRGSRHPVRHFVGTGFPAALYRSRWWWITLGLVLAALATALVQYVAANPEVAALFLSEEEMRRYVEEDFVGYYSEYRAQNFAARVWTNNALLTMQCLAAGVLIVPVLYLLGSNLLSLGMAGGVMFGAGEGGTFLTYLAPHGFLELTSVFVGAGVGLRTAWTWIPPGPLRTRGQALAACAREAMVVAVGLVPVLAVAGLLEAYVTPSTLPAGLRIGVGCAVWLLFLGYALGLGRAADARWNTAEDSDLPTA